MRRFGSLAAILLIGLSLRAATTNDLKPDGVESKPKLSAPEHLPKFDELYQLLRTNLGGVSETDLDHAVVKGLLNQLQSQVSLVDSSNAPSPSATGLSQVKIYDNAFAYFRFGKIAGDVASKFSSSYHDLVSTNKGKVKGVILDLRFSGGTDYTAAAAVADRFLDSERALLDWGTGKASATTKTNSISVPVAILINAETSGAAEALAAILRDTNVGLLIGSKTAGLASVFREFSLTNGQKLRIATAQIKLGDGTVLAQGLKPDIEVTTSSGDERAYLDDPYKVLHKTDLARSSETETNLPSTTSTNHTRRRYNEAELVRQQKEGVDLESEAEATPKRTEPDKPALADPALVRALDLLKGLAVVHQARPG
jgi:hypothetical protein